MKFKFSNLLLLHDVEQGNSCRYAIKFFSTRAGFERERRLHDKPAMPNMVPAVIEAISNEDRRYRTEDGFVFPPCLVMERGESSEEVEKMGPLTPQRPQGEKGLVEALDTFAASGKLLFDSYVVRGAQDRRFGGQGVVQFAQDPHTQEQYAPAFP
jgi:hypothetical protein